ncbi:precorrin-3B C(17)-methyltransferase [Clostridium botulinum]|uniref:Precorrin-3B C(17)-methyltransferase n=1 Tax=Clostridium botulinum D str. 1873 TaxID=592027 RepID=A0A9P2G9E8_CLOBO|nr:MULTISPECIES: precorrin-3B C(17)-methyltransferase [Clostridium]AYF54140.1 precorrin-3B C(17)-methyltransferase [Clostridium novyi]EES92400.1 precorrin-3B C(17)-methyltransferase [Clostridium botulinum D str. 1873]MBO3442492.1 precorrin-3B C(17)-methyltransferase [Clostridium haemolyticum]MCD3216465.1 precorrin-3B C(17)-methyltransferase [Clostridium botulinum C]MCD3246189.1 precorrin-3B C(17)-methyltransferase [Clostridium botulinum C]
MSENKGKLYVIGIGPGSLEEMSIRAKNAIEESDIIVGYTKYIELIKPIINGKKVFSTGMRGEIQRVKYALNESKENVVSIISTGDAGIYGMAGPILEIAENEDIIVIPGITAASSAASLLGAPLMHDNCNISLSDLLTPYEVIKNRVECAAKGDFIISLYNPKSKGRPHYLRECLDIIKRYRNNNTPIGIVKNALREGQEVTITTIEKFNDDIVDMMSIVVIGNSKSYIKNSKFITPRGYGNKAKGEIK